jgi:hypothetical protein
MRFETAGTAGVAVEAGSEDVARLGSRAGFSEGTEAGSRAGSSEGAFESSGVSVGKARFFRFD